MLRVILVITGISVFSFGCTSMSSTLLNRTDNDIFVGNSNGEPGVHCEARPFKGVPITMRVPTHLDITVTERIYLRKVKGNLVRVQTKHRQLFVTPSIVETDKVFTVDPKRPAAGTLAATLTFGLNNEPNGPDNSQYFNSIQDEIQDDTIKDVTSALSTLIPTLNKLTGRDDAADQISATLQGQLIVEYRTVAWKRFDLDAVDFEHQVTDFVSLHMNCCNSCQAYTNDNSFSSAPSTPGTPIPVSDDPGTPHKDPAPGHTPMPDPATTPMPKQGNSPMPNGGSTPPPANGGTPMPGQGNTPMPRQGNTPPPAPTPGNQTTPVPPDTTNGGTQKSTSSSNSFLPLFDRSAAFIR